MSDVQIPGGPYINSIIGEGTRFNGEFDLNGLLRIDGYSAPLLLYSHLIGHISGEDFFDKLLANLGLKAEKQRLSQGGILVYCQPHSKGKFCCIFKERIVP